MMQDIKYIRMRSSNCLKVRQIIFSDRNKPRANNRKSFIDNPYLFLVIYQYISNTLAMYFGM